MPGLMVSEFVVVWFELNWLRDVAGSAFFGEKGTPVRRVLLQPGRFVGGLASRLAGESAKSVYKVRTRVCSRSDSGLCKQRRFSAKPRISSPPAESGDRQHTPHGLAFQGGRVVWLLGSWMSYQRYAVLKYKQC
mgnify:CR=1 FL=1